MNLFLIFISAFLINNVVFMRFLGLCPLVGVSNKMSLATVMSMAVMFVMTFTSWITWTIYKFILLPFNLVYLKTVTFMLVIATLVQLIEMGFKRFVPTIYKALGIYLPLITTNCIIFGAILIIIDFNYSFLQATIFAIGTALGFGLAMILLVGIRERLEFANLPETMKEAPIIFITVSLVALAFLGFRGFISFSF